MGILLSIITPCYNHGIFLDEMLESVHSHEWAFEFEHIIINDGSTDAFTNTKLETLNSIKNVKVINQTNKGLASARNNGIVNSNGKYILPLDADNKIVAGVFEMSTKLLEVNNEIDVFFTDCEYFGEHQGIRQVESFDIEKMLYCNYIDACALIRKSSLLCAGCYDSNMPYMGHEDWELWLKMKFRNNIFYYYPKVGFYYRVNKNSMLRTDTERNHKANKEYLFKKYAENISEVYDKIYKKNKAHYDYIKYKKFQAVLKIILDQKFY